MLVLLLRLKAVLGREEAETGMGEEEVVVVDLEARMEEMGTRMAGRARMPLLPGFREVWAGLLRRL